MTKSPRKPNIGKQRYSLYKNCFSQYNKAMATGYYLEAICLVESLIADRLESFLCAYHDDLNYSGLTLGELCQQITKLKGNQELTKLMALSEQLKLWAKNRNKAIHEMAKIKDNNQEEWILRVAENKATAEKGLNLCREIQKEIAMLKRLSAKQISVDGVGD